MHDQFLMAPPGFDKEIQAELVRNGYAVIPSFFNPEQMARIWSMWEYFSSQRDVMSPMNKDVGYRSTLTTATDRDTVFRRIVNGALMPDVEAAVANLTLGYRLIGTGFIDKEPGFGLLPMHQDASIVQDETKIQCVTIWVALVDVDETNGGLSVIPRSHLHHRSPRGLFSAFPGLEHEVTLREHFSRQVPLKAGQAVIFDRSLFHDSAPNFSRTRRPAVQIVLAPKHQPCYFHVHREVDGKAMLDCYAVPDDFFLTHVFGTEPDPALKVGSIPEVIDPLSLDSLAMLQRAEPH